MISETCLVTGVAGFVGSHLAERMLCDGNTVIGVDCFTDYYSRSIKERNLAGLRRQARFHFVEADLVQSDLVDVLTRPPALGRPATSGPGEPLAGDGGVGYVFHLAAQAGVRESWGSNFEVYARNNVLATQKLLDAAKQANLKKFVYASSSSIYGDAETLPTPETVIPRPISPYGVTKLAAEHLAWLYWRNYGVPVVGLRYFTVFGPRQRPDMAFHKFIRAILEGSEITIYGDGRQTRDFTFVQDAVEGTLAAAVSDAVGEVFNIGGGSRVSVREVIGMLETITGRAARVRYLAPCDGDVRDTSADIRRAVDSLSYAPRHTLADGLSAEVEWLKGVL